MSEPVVMTYTEGAETYHVHADGLISRPAIKFGPSGGWRFVGIGTASGRLVATFPELVAMLATGETLPRNFHVHDLDHGTRRSHGHSLTAAAMRLIPVIGHGHSIVDLVRRLDNERRHRETAAREAAAAERLAMARRGGKSLGIWDGVELRRNGNEFYVIDDGNASEGLRFKQAAQQLGAALIDHAS